MALLISPVLREKVLSLTPLEKTFLKPYGVSSLFSLHGIALDIPFLKAASHFWDLTHHVFRFGVEEICPTIEEFAAILGMGGNLTAFLEFRKDYRDPFTTFLGIPSQEAESFVVNNGVNLDLLLHYFLPSRIVGRPDPSSIRYKVMAFALVSQFLLPKEDGNGDMRVAELLPQLLHGRSLIPIILAETLNSLDAWCVDSNAFFTGSLLLLQIWLQEKLRIVSDPKIDAYGPQHFASRKRVIPCGPSELEWVGWMENHAADNIRWISLWWKCPLPILATRGFKGVCLMGLNKTSFYHARRVLRQFGLDQTIPEAEERKKTYPPTLLRMSTVQWGKRYFDFHDMATQRMPQADTYELSNDYYDWIKKETHLEEKNMKGARMEWKKTQETST